MAGTLLTGSLLSLWPALAMGAGGDCLSGNTIDCFDCNSWDDPRCHDPWNWTYPKHHMPPVAPCEGCCVKMVQFIGTDHYQVAVLKQNIPSEMEVAPRTDRYHVKDLKQKTFWGVL